MECLFDIVGLSQDPEVCNLYLLSNESKSGLYIDDTSKGRIPVDQAFFSNTVLLEHLIPQAVNQAIQKIHVACERRLVRHYGVNRCTIGYKDDWTDYLPASTDYYYLCIKGKGIRGGIVQFNKIKIHTQSGLHTGNIVIYSDGAEIYNGNLSDFTPKTISIENDIFIAYKGARPKNFKHTGCCGKYPQYQGYVLVGSGIGATTNDFIYEDSSYSNGIELDVTFDCYPWGFLCNLDFTKSTFGVVFAKLVQQIARSNIGYWIMTDDKISPYSQVKSEELQVILEYLDQDIQSMLNYLPENLSQSDCFICNGVYKNEILI